MDIAHQLLKFTFPYLSTKLTLRHQSKNYVSKAATPNHNNTVTVFEITASKPTNLPELEPPQSHLTEGDCRAVPVTSKIL